MPLLELRGLGKDYGRSRAVGALDLDVAEGEIVGLLGPNGAGKTTTISMVCGVVRPTRGVARVAGHDIATAPRSARAAIGLIPQDLAIYEPLTAVENLRYFGAVYGLRGATLRERIAWGLDIAGLADRARERVDRFSGGMKRRLNLVAGLLHRPRLVVLDEPTVGVDPQSRNHIFETIRALRADGVTVLYSSHYMEEVEALCDRVAIMDRGAIVAAGPVAELLDRPDGAVIEVEIEGDDGAVAAAVAAAEAAGGRVASVERRRASLEDVFLELTGRTLRDE